MTWLFLPILIAAAVAAYVGGRAVASRRARTLPAGEYQVITDEELIEGLSFPVYRRVSTMMLIPAQSHAASSIEMVTIDPAALQTARDRDAEAAK